MWSFKHAILIVPFIAAKRTQAIEVAPGSKCSSLCIDTLGTDEASPYTSTTVGSMIVCNDGELSGSNSTAKGQKWMSCIGCESTSNYYDDATRENDVFWFLRRLHYHLTNRGRMVARIAVLIN